MHHFGVWHLVPDPLEDRRHLERHRAGDDHQIALPRAGTEDFGAETRDIETRGAGGDHFDGAAGEAEVSGQMDDSRAQLNTWSTLVVTIFCSNWFWMKDDISPAFYHQESLFETQGFRGLTLVARRAGIRQAATEPASSTAPEMAKASGSRGLTWNSRLSR